MVTVDDAEESLLDGLASLLHFQKPRGPCRGRARVCLFFERVQREARLLAAGVDKGAIRNGQKPGPQVVNLGPRVPRAPDACGNILEKVFGIVKIAAQPTQQPQNGSAVLVKDRRELIVLGPHIRTLSDLRALHRGQRSV